MSRDDSTLVRRAFSDTRRPPQPGFANRVLTRVHERGADDPGGRRQEHRGRLLPLVAAAIAIVVVLVLLGGTGRLHLALPRLSGGPAGPPPSMPPPGPVGPDPYQTFVYPAGATGKGTPNAYADWNGKQVGIYPPSVQPIYVSDDGSLLAGTTNGKTWQIWDRQGKPLSQVSSFGDWSKDGAHVSCNLVLGNRSATITTIDFRDPAHPSTRSIKVDTGNAPPLQRNWAPFSACSAVHDRMVAVGQEVQTGVRGPSSSRFTEVDVIQLSTGRVLSRRALSAAPGVIGVAISPDGKYLAETYGLTRTDVLDLDTGKVAGHVTGVICGFSGDDSLALLGACGEWNLGKTASVIAWRTGHIVWSVPGSALIKAIKPDAPDLAIFFQTVPPSGSGISNRVVIVHADGTTIDLPHTG
jgi:hypothetical protein